METPIVLSLFYSEDNQLGYSAHFKFNLLSIFSQSYKHKEVDAFLNVMEKEEKCNVANQHFLHHFPKTFYDITTLGFQRIIAITNFLVSHTCEIRFNEVMALYLCIPRQQFQNMADLHGQIRMFWTFIF